MSSFGAVDVMRGVTRVRRVVAGALPLALVYTNVFLCVACSLDWTRNLLDGVPPQCGKRSRCGH